MPRPPLARFALALRPLPALTVALALAAAGCEDDAAARRAQVQTQIEEAGRNLSLASLYGAVDRESAAALRNQLESVARSVSSVNDGSDAQQSAAATIAATARHELGLLGLVEIESIESMQVAQRDEAWSIIGAARALGGIAQASASLSTQDARAALDRAKAEIESARTRAAQRMRELESPIRDREGRIANAQQRVSSLTSQADGLRRQSIDQGPADGFPTFERAVELEREADAKELEIAGAELELNLEYRPEHELADARSRGASELLEAIEEADGALDSADRRRGEIAAEINRGLGEMRGRLSEILKSLDASAAEMDELAQRTREDLDQALSLAGRAAAKAGRENAGPARLLEVRAQSSLARLAAMRAQSLAAHAAIAEALAELGGADAARQRDAAKSSRALADAAHTEAIAAIDAAAGTLGQVPDRGGHVESLRIALDAAKASLEGRASAAASGSGDRGASRSDVGGATAKGFDSPDAALDAMIRSNAGDMAAAQAVLAACRATSPGARTLLTVQRTLMPLQSRLLAAMTKQFGEVDESMMQGLGLSMGNPRLAEESEDRAVILAEVMPGQEVELALERDGDAWYVNCDGMVDAMTSAAPEAAGMMEMLGGALPQIRSAIEAVITRVEAGEFASPEEAGQALGMAVAQAMMGG